MVCSACKNLIHDKQPKDCKGGTWCDCQHRLPIEISTDKEQNNE